MNLQDLIETELKSQKRLALIEKRLTVLAEDEDAIMDMLEEVYDEASELVCEHAIVESTVSYLKLARALKEDREAFANKIVNLCLTGK